MPLELFAHTVSHLKALISYNSEPREQGHGSTFSICHSLLKNAILLHIEAIVRIFFGASVHYSDVPNRRPGPNKRPGRKFCRNQLVSWAQ